MIYCLSIQDLLKQLGENWVLVVVFGLILLLIGVIAGYLIGNTSLRSHVTESMDALEREKLIQKAVLDNVGLGIVVYDKKEAIFVNESIFKLPGFLKSGLPDSLDAFLEAFDNGNQLKSNYILSCENGINTIRVNYLNENRIYEIKILKKKATDESKFFAGEDLAIVIVDDITQVKDDERRQKDLAANVSHELKTPLTSVYNSVFSILKSGENGGMPPHDDLMLWAQRIQVNATRMQDIINDFLVLSQCSHTSVMGIFDIKEVVEMACANISEYPGRQNVTITMPDEGQYPLVYGNSKLVMRTIINLLTNAIKYIDYDNKKVPNQIHIGIVMIDDRIGVQVEDNGRGIPAKDIDHLFERFYRVDNSGNHEVGGTGIGLAIAKEIAEMHDGAISVTSTFGSGSTFTLSLPAGKTVFDGVYADARAGIISEKPLYRAAAYFLGLQECEAARSMNYEDLLPIIEEYEAKEATDTLGRDKILAKLLAEFGNERFAELEDELLYVEDMEEDGPLTGLEEEPYEEPLPAMESPLPDAAMAIDSYTVAAGEEELARISAAAEEARLRQEEKRRAQQQAKEKIEQERLRREEEDRRIAEIEQEEKLRQEEEQKRLAKEEARAILTRPVVQMAANPAEPKKNAAELAKDNKEKHVIHPTVQGKRYNIDDIVARKTADKKVTEEPAEAPQVKSSLKQVLDGSTPLPDQHDN